VPSPVIPNLYDRVARWHMQQYGTTREQLVSGFVVQHVVQQLYNSRAQLA
jgi:hypothetical protein